jgi:hypothetical protein
LAALVHGGSNPDFDPPQRHLCFSNRPVGVKRFQTIHDCGVGITRGLALLFGLGLVIADELIEETA